MSEVNAGGNSKLVNNKLDFCRRYVSFISKPFLSLDLPTLYYDIGTYINAYIDCVRYAKKLVELVLNLDTSYDDGLDRTSMTRLTNNHLNHLYSYQCVSLCTVS